MALTREHQQLRGDVIAWLTASAHDDPEALQAAYDALIVHPAAQLFAQFTTLVFVAGAADSMDLEQLQAFFAQIGLGIQRSAVGITRDTPGPPVP